MLLVSAHELVEEPEEPVVGDPQVLSSGPHVLSSGPQLWFLCVGSSYVLAIRLELMNDYNLFQVP